MSRRKVKRFGIEVPEHIYNELKADAARKGITLTRYMLQVLINHMRKNGMSVPDSENE